MSRAVEADALIAEARAIDPENELVVQHTDVAPDATQTHVVAKPEITFAAPIEVQPKPGPQDVHLRGDARQVLTKAALQYGINVVYDEGGDNRESADSVRSGPEPVHRGDPLLLRMTHLFAVPLDAKDPAGSQGYGGGIGRSWSARSRRRSTFRRARQSR